MMPELILNHRYELSREYITKCIQQYDFRGNNGFEVCRIGGYRLKTTNNGTEIIAWQCNMAEVQNYDVVLPTIISIKLDNNSVLRQIELDECFKGSQGIPCSYKFLNRRLQQYNNKSFLLENKELSNSLNTGCRHTFELLYGACAFYEYCKKNSCDDAWVSETTTAYKKEESIIAIDRISVNGEESRVHINISNYRNNIQYNQQGAIYKCEGLNISGIGYDNCLEQRFDVKEIIANDVNEFRLKVMKILSKYWLYSGKAININSKFYFSQMWPPTLFGILNQMFALSIYSNSYSYFQHCIRGLQKDDISCACIGVCEDINECKKYFSDFSIEDLY